MVAALVGTGFFIGSIMQKYGISHFETLRFWLGLGMHLWLIFIILRAHSGLTQIIEAGEENLTPGLRRMANW
jgi:multisubunit Na+/H+ antiporter MnhE subunit